MAKELSNRQESPKKTTKYDFINSFKLTIDSIVECGYKGNLSPIKVNKDMKIISGAHRLAICTYLDTPIHISVEDQEVEEYSQEFFEKKLIDNSSLRRIFLGVVQRKQNLRVLLLFPIDSGLVSNVIQQIESKFPILFHSEIALNYELSYHLKKISYFLHSTDSASSNWCGDDLNNFEGIRTHVFNSNYKGSLNVYVYEDRDDLDVIGAKQEIRDLAGNGNYSIHSSDSHSETVDLLNILFSEESLKILSLRKPTDHYFNQLIDSVHSYSKMNRIPPSSFAISGSGSMGALGLRNIRDIDLIVDVGINFKENYRVDLVNLQEDNYFDKSFNTLIYASSNYFWFYGLKFLRLGEIKEMKLKRNEYPKDLIDVNLIDSIYNTANTKFRDRIMFEIRVSLFKAMLRARKLKILLYDFLVWIRLYRFVRRYILNKK